MTAARTALTRWGNALGVWLYRRSGGRIAGPGKGTTIGLLTVPGRLTGIPRTVAIGFHPHGTGYLAVGSGSGSRQEPQWFRNLRATGHAQIQIGTALADAHVRVAGPAERDTLWRDIILVQAPWRGRHEEKAGRVIPVAVLTPRQPPSLPGRPQPPPSSRLIPVQARTDDDLQHAVEHASNLAERHGEHCTAAAPGQLPTHAAPGRAGQRQEEARRART